MSGENYRAIFDLLVQERSIPFLQLVEKSATSAAMDERQVREIVDELEKRELVRITNKGDVGEIIAVREKAFVAGRSL
jgi:hypothetical protein